MYAEPLMKREGSGKGQPALTFSLPSPPLEKAGARCPQPAARSCPARRGPPRRVNPPPPLRSGPGSRGVKVGGGGSARSPLPAAGPPPPASPLPACSPARGGQPRPPGVVVLPGFNARGSAFFPPFLFFSFPVLPALGVKPHSSVSIANNVGR